MDFDVIFIAGPQGSGKGTQGRKLAEKLGFFFWDTGSVLREMMREKHPLAERISAINQGVLLSDDLIQEVLQQKLGSLSKDQGIIFDGVPRRIGQAQFLLPFLRTEGKSRMATLFFDLPREESIRRLLLRAEQEKRADDTLEAIEFRLRQYEEAIAPTLDYLKQETRFFNIDGRPSVEEVEKNVNATLGL